MRNIKLMSVFAIAICCLLLCFSGCEKQEKKEKKDYNTAENISMINEYLNVTLPKSSNITHFYHRSNKRDNVLEVKVDIDKSDHDEFINSINDHYEASREPVSSSYSPKLWWDYEIDDVVNSFEIMKSPVTTYDFGQKLTAYETIVIVDNGDNYSLFMSYVG